MAQSQCLMNSKIGPIFLVATEFGLQAVSFEKQKVQMASNLKGSSAEIKILNKAIKQLQEYFSGQRKIFDLPLDLVGTEFQRKVWRQLSKIKYGKTFSYKDIAHQIKNPKAFRAVGSANGKNPICIIIPCHRVIANDGSMGGYSGGPKIKTKLLELEGKF